MIETWDLNIRWMVVGVSLFLIIALATGQARRELKIALIGVLAGAMAYVLNATPLGAPESPLDPWVDLLSLFTPFWIWIFALRLFEREPPLTVTIGIVALLTIAWFAGNFFTGPEMVAFYAIHIVSLFMIADLVRVAWRDRADDLIEKRRLIRLVLPLLVAAQAGGILVFEMAVGAAVSYPWVQLANAVLILALTFFAGLILLRTDPELLVETVDDGPKSEVAPPDLSPSEIVLHERLSAAMGEGQYREPGLTIAVLAAHLDTPEHRLRALINRRLGHRNFSAFLNRHRIAEAKVKLSDRAEVDIPVLTIAMDLGYNSLATFNRAFRSETGTTPSEFRRLAITSVPDQN